ncbi:MAG: Trk system potassium transporter TrkA [Verrucomicrobiota bacterium]
MKIIIVGAGEIGRHMAASVSREAHDTVVIDADEARATELDELLDARVLQGDGSSVSLLLEAGVAECDLFFSLTSSNNTNLVSSSIAKKLGAKKVICRVHASIQREEWLFDHRGHFGIDYIFSPERLASVELAKFIRNPDSIMVEELARGRIELQQVRLPMENPLEGKTLRELKLPDRVRIGAIARQGTHIIPTANEKVLGGDMVIFFGEPRKLRETLDKLLKNNRRQEQPRVVILGGGEYGFALAQMLEASHFRVRIFEVDRERAEELANRLEKAVIINADATSVNELKEEQVGEAEFFVAATSSDEDNVMTCLQAHNLGTHSCLSLIHRADYADAISSFGSKFGVVAAVSPREAVRRELTRFITSDSFHLVRKFGEVEVIETTVPEGSGIVGLSLQEIEWPEESVIIARIHSIHATVPSATDTVEPGDNLFAMVSAQTRKPFLKLVHG